MKTAPCPACGSTSPRALDHLGRCANLKGCNERRCRRRKDLDDAIVTMREQCHATIGHPSISFCLLRQGHSGLHLNGTREWDGNEEHPIAKMMRERRTGV